MNARSLSSILDRIGQALPADLAAGLNALPDIKSFPSAWALWLYLSLCHFREQQVWAKRLVRNRVSPQLKGQGLQVGCGIVPGLMRWEFCFEGVQWCLIDRMTGRHITWRYDNGVAIDPNNYDHYLQSIDAMLTAKNPGSSLFNPQVPEELFQAGLLIDLRQRVLDPSGQSKAVAFAELKDRRWISPSRQGVHLNNRPPNWGKHIASLHRAMSDPTRRLWTGALLNDWLLAHEAAQELGDGTLVAITAKRAGKCQRERISALNAGLAIPDEVQAGALYGLADMKDPGLSQALENALVGGHNRPTLAALDIVTRKADSSWCEPVYRLFKSLNPDEESTQPLWFSCADFLVQHDYRREEVIPAITQGPIPSRMALTLLKYAPEHALPVFRRALRTDESDAIFTAGLLGTINRPWCRRELAEALRESTDPERTWPYREVLRGCGYGDARRMVHEWEARHLVGCEEDRFDPLAMLETLNPATLTEARALQDIIPGSSC